MKKNILIGVTGSVAAVKLAELCLSLLNPDTVSSSNDTSKIENNSEKSTEASSNTTAAVSQSSVSSSLLPYNKQELENIDGAEKQLDQREIRVILTSSAMKFIIPTKQDDHDVDGDYENGSKRMKELDDNKMQLMKSSPASIYHNVNYQQFMKLVKNGTIKLYTDEDEWKDYKQVGKDPVLHIELRKWADVFVIAPLSANSLAKLSNGLADNLVTCVARAWDVSKPMIVAPAMNTMMWTHPITQKQLSVLEGFGFVTVIQPIIKTLACNDSGTGAMAHVSTIVTEIMSKVQ